MRRSRLVIRRSISRRSKGQYNRSPQSLGGSTVPIGLYVEDVDAFAEKAIAAGAKVIFPIADWFYGDRGGRLQDPFGHMWIVSTHKEDVAPEEMTRRAEAWMKEMGSARAEEAAHRGCRRARGLPQHHSVSAGQRRGEADRVFPQCVRRRRDLPRAARRGDRTCATQDRRFDDRSGRCDRQVPAQSHRDLAIRERCGRDLCARAQGGRDLAARADRPGLRRPRGERERPVRQSLVHRDVIARTPSRCPRACTASRRICIRRARRR